MEPFLDDAPPRSSLLWAAAILIVALAAGAGIYFLNQARQEKKTASFLDAYAAATGPDARFGVVKANLSLPAAAPELLDLGGAYLQAGNVDAAQAAFSLFIAHFPHHPLLAGAQLGEANALIARKQWEAAEPLLEKLADRTDAKTEGYRPAALFHLGLVREELKDKDGARQALQELIAKYPSSAFVSQAQSALDSLH